MAEKAGESESTNGDNDTFLLLSYLDEVESGVESLRRHASALSQERLSLLTVLQQLKEESLNSSVTEGESQEILINIDRLQKRCEAVDITVHTSRSRDQEDAFSKVDALVKDLEEMCILEDPNDIGYHDKARSYLNACVSDVVGGPIDYKFQGLVLGCKLEDQKELRQRLESLVKGKCHVSYIEHLENAFVKEGQVEEESDSHSCCDNSPSESCQVSASEHTSA